MESKQKISIIIPTYNASKTISAALESILEQSFNDYEILVIDGLSTDNTIDIVKSYNDERIKIISEKDSGIYDAMNKGIRLAEGEWIYFLGSDDRLAGINTLQEVNKYLSDEYDFIYGNVFWGDTHEIYDGPFDLEKLIRKKNICHQAIFYNRRLFNFMGDFNTEYKTCADYDFNIQCFIEKRKILYIDIVLAYFCVSGISSTSDDSLFEKKRISTLIELFEDIRDIYSNNLKYKEIITSKRFIIESLIKKKIKSLFGIFKILHDHKRN